MAVNTMAESTSGAIGQDADGVAALASAFRIASNRVSGLADRLSTWRAVSGWSGPDASSFEASMRSTFASMRQAAGSLASAHTALVRNASEQRQTSAPEALLGVDAAAATVLAAFSTGTANWLAGLTDRPPNWMPVSRSQVVFDVQASGEILAGGGQLRLEVVEYLDGRATVSARAEPELLAQLGLGNAAYVGGGGQIVAGATYSFDNADDAHAFVDALPDGLWPEASDAPFIAMGLSGLFAGGGLLSAAPYAAREVHETATKNGGELTSAEIGAGAVVAGGLHPLPHAPAGRLGLDADAKIVETYEYDAVGGGLVRVLNADASIAAGLLGAEIEGDVSASLSMPVPTVMPPAPGSEPAMVDYTLTVRTEAAGSKNLLGAFGLADLTAIAGASTTTGVVITAKLRSEQVIGLGGDPRPFLDLGQRMLGEADVYVQVLGGTGGGPSLSTPVVQASVDWSTENTLAAWEKKHGQPLVEIDL